MKKYFIYCLLLIAVAACNKDKFQTKPQIKYKSSNTDIVPIGGILRVNLEFTDKEGDLDSVYVIRQRLNKKNPVPNKLLPFELPEFNSQTEGEIILNLSQVNSLSLQLTPIPIPGQNKFERDTLKLKFVAKDKAKNISDTIDRDFIVIR
jgi:hypothetical protein